ncbi:hypothetical protein AGR4A_pAt10025 [Agrobacterium tumefaciens str. B6]|uniref:Uncharacterized protein n=1 Tax=Agrobacterium tumefaciens str. B6 TaxID=1183423 RepID=A0A822V595_AGRTU|nr:hypothetical protein AGR4A_pAt10025 [Agrobacterium tumefaciens str. B6]
MRSEPFQGPDRLLNSPTRPIIAAAANTASESLKRRYGQHMLLASKSARASDHVEAENRSRHPDHVYRNAAPQKAGHQQ